MQKTLADAGGTVLGIAADTVEQSRKVVDRNELEFDILSDKGAEVITRYGLLFDDPFGRGNISLPSNILLDRDGEVVWQFMSSKVQERPHPADVKEQVERVLRQ